MFTPKLANSQNFGAGDKYQVCASPHFHHFVNISPLCQDLATRRHFVKILLLIGSSPPSHIVHSQADPAESCNAQFPALIRVATQLICTKLHLSALQQFFTWSSALICVAQATAGKFRTGKMQRGGGKQKSPERKWTDREGGDASVVFQTLSLVYLYLYLYLYLYCIACRGSEQRDMSL